nr:hypothetical protein [Granulosicoccus sp.]
MVRVWAATLLLVVLVLYTLSLSSGFKPLEFNLDGADVAAIGTSLIGSGLDRDGSLLSSIADSRRLALFSATPIEILEISENSLTQHAKVIVIEAQPFLRLLKNHRRIHESSWVLPIDGLNRSLNEFTKNLRNSIKSIFALTLQRKTYKYGRWVRDRANDTSLTNLDVEKLERAYPPTIIPTPFANRLNRFLNAARDKNTRTLFVLMPISASASSYLGRDYLHSLEERFQKFSLDHDVEIWSPATIWADDYFWDHAHFNRLGRARFTKALRNYLTDESS